MEGGQESWSRDQPYLHGKDSHSQNKTQSEHTRCYENVTVLEKTYCTKNKTLLGQVKCTPAKQMKCSRKVTHALKLMPAKLIEKKCRNQTVTPTRQVKCSEIINRALQAKCTRDEILRKLSVKCNGTVKPMQKVECTTPATSKVNSSRTVTLMRRVPGTQAVTKTSEVKDSKSKAKVFLVPQTQIMTKISKVNDSENKAKVCLVAGTQAVTQTGKVNGTKSKTEKSQVSETKNVTKIGEVSDTQNKTRVNMVPGAQTGEIPGTKNVTNFKVMLVPVIPQSVTKAGKVNATENACKAGLAPKTQTDYKTDKVECTEDKIKVSPVSGTQEFTKASQINVSPIENNFKKVNDSQNVTRLEQATLVHPHSYVKADNSTAPVSRTITGIPENLLEQVTPSVARTIRLASQSIKIPSKSRMILLNSPVQLNTDALVKASLNAVKLSEGAQRLTGHQEAPVYNVNIQEPKHAVEKTKDNVMDKTNAEVLKLKEHTSTVGLSEKNAHHSDLLPSKSLNSTLLDSSSKLQVSGVSPSILQVDSGSSYSSSPSKHPTSSSTHLHYLGQTPSNFHEKILSPFDSSLSKTYTQAIPQFDSKSAKPQNSDLSQSKCHEISLLKSESPCISSVSTLTPQTVESNPCNTLCEKSTYSSNLNESKPLTGVVSRILPKSAFTSMNSSITAIASDITNNPSEKDRSMCTSDSLETQKNGSRHGKHMVTRSQAKDIESMHSKECPSKRTRNGLNKDRSSNSRTPGKQEKTSISVAENHISDLPASRPTESGKDSSIQLKPKVCNGNHIDEKTTPVSNISEPISSVCEVNGKTELKLSNVGENNTVILRKTSFSKRIENLKNHIPRQCECHSENQRHVMADQVFMKEGRGLEVVHFPNIRMLLIQDKEMIGIIQQGLLYISVAEIQQKLLRTIGIKCLKEFLKEHDSEQRYLAKELRLFLNDTTFLLQTEFMISVHYLKKFLNKMCQCGVPGVHHSNFWSEALHDENFSSENFYVKISGHMWCMSCQGHVIQERTINVYTDIELVSVKKDQECESEPLSEFLKDKEHSASSKTTRKEGKETIKVGYVRISHSAFTAYKVNDVCFVSLLQLQLKRVISIHCIEYKLQRLNSFPQKPPAVVEKHFKRNKSLFENTEWIDMNILRCVCCMEKLPKEYLNKKLIKCIVSNNIQENFTCTLHSLDDSATDPATDPSYISIRDMGFGSNVEANIVSSEYPIQDTEDQDTMGKGKAVRERLVLMFLKSLNSCNSSESSEASDLQENIVSDNIFLKSRSESDIQCDQTSEQSDFNLPRLEKLRTAEKTILGKRKRKLLLPKTKKKRKYKMTSKTHHSSEKSALKHQNPCVASSSSSEPEEDLDMKGFSVHQVSPPELQSSQIMIKNEPMELEDGLSAPDIPRVVIERETVEHEYLQEAATSAVGLYQNVVFPGAEVMREMECSTTITDNLCEKPNCDQKTPEYVIQYNDGDLSKEIKSEIDRFRKDKFSDCEDSVVDSGLYKHDFVTLGISSEAGFIKVELPD
ncbi:uncharacterized protein LOC132544942 [Ylistrum balloti]|uniref:uncharacterized protein LOC132544942 n=1 Tax=Ylistrum balloti TaxID=509963 RepID=UPI0029059B88|nr:uncharacterized protein LOC132544942 [Ylistrum balloti]